MKHLLITFSILLLSLCLFSCKSKQALEATPDTTVSNTEEDLMYAEMGKDMCKCMEPTLKIAEDLKGKTPEEVSDLLVEMQQEGYKMEDCVEELKSKYPSIDFEAASNPKAEKALLENCPAYKKAIEEKKG